MRYLFPLSQWNGQRQFEKPVWVYPVTLASYATYLKNEGHDVVWGELKEEPIFNGCHIELYKNIEDDFQIDVPFEKLPYPDRVFTDAKNTRWQKYGNYKYHPATHMMVSNLCWWGNCTFCEDTLNIKNGEKRYVRPIDDVMEEIDELISLGFKEVFDDSGTFPTGQFLDSFIRGLHDIKSSIIIGCNMRMVDVDYRGMRDAGFRMLLFGVESANQETLDRVNKGVKVEDIKYIKKAAEAGLEPHITVMFGYPWETNEDALNTVRLVHYLLKKGYAKTAQASVYSPPRTSPDPNSPGHKYVPMIYDAYRSPEFLYHKLRDIKCWADVKYIGRGVRLVAEEKWRKLK